MTIITTIIIMMMIMIMIIIIIIIIIIRRRRRRRRRRNITYERKIEILPQFQSEHLEINRQRGRNKILLLCHAINLCS
jgi:hypothetical protein